MKSQTRNLNPHAEAVAAMWLFGTEYAAGGSGSMDFWDGLSETRKRLCYEMVDDVLAARRAPALAKNEASHAGNSEASL